MSRREVLELIRGQTPEIKQPVELLSERLEKIRLEIEAGKAPSEYSRKNYPNKGQKILVIGDSHCGPGINNRRFDWLGRMIQEEKPQIVVDIGDFYSMSSLSSFERPGSAKFASQNYVDDILPGIDAQWRLWSAIKDMDEPPRMVRCLGNHEYRLNRVLEQDPRQLYGLISTVHFSSSLFGWEENPYMSPVTIQGIAFCHYYKEKGSYTTKHLAANALSTRHESWVFGHAHRFDYKREGSAMAACSGCFFEHNEDWLSESSQEHWDRGILILHDCYRGRFDPDWWSMDRIRSHYG
jgi:predicted phosphodiesterase